MSYIITCSSILPGLAAEITRPNYLEFDPVMESISSAANGKKGEELSAGIIYGWLTNRETGKRFDRLVCEHNGNYYESELKHKLQAILHKLFCNGFEEKYQFGDTRMINQFFIPK